MVNSFKSSSCKNDKQCKSWWNGSSESKKKKKKKKKKRDQKTVFWCAALKGLLTKWVSLITMILLNLALDNRINSKHMARGHQNLVVVTPTSFRPDACANSVDPDKTDRKESSHQDLHCLLFCFFSLDWNSYFQQWTSKIQRLKEQLPELRWKSINIVQKLLEQKVFKCIGTRACIK